MKKKLTTKALKALIKDQYLWRKEKHQDALRKLNPRPNWTEGDKVPTFNDFLNSLQTAAAVDAIDNLLGLIKRDFK